MSYFFSYRIKKVKFSKIGIFTHNWNEQNNILRNFALILTNFK